MTTLRLPALRVPTPLRRPASSHVASTPCDAPLSLLGVLAAGVVVVVTFPLMLIATALHSAIWAGSLAWDRGGRGRWVWVPLAAIGGAVLMVWITLHWTITQEGPMGRFAGLMLTGFAVGYAIGSATEASHQGRFTARLAWSIAGVVAALVVWWLATRRGAKAGVACAVGLPGTWRDGR